VPPLIDTCIPVTSSLKSVIWDTALAASAPEMAWISSEDLWMVSARLLAVTTISCRLPSSSPALALDVWTVSAVAASARLSAGESKPHRVTLQMRLILAGSQ